MSTICHFHIINTVYWGGKNPMQELASIKNINVIIMPPSRCRYPSGLWGVTVVSLGLVQRQVWWLRRAAPHTLHPNAPSQQWSCLPPAGGRQEVLPWQLFMTRPGKEGEERKERKDREKRKKNQEREERKKTEKQQKKVCSVFTWGITMTSRSPLFPSWSHPLSIATTNVLC